MRVIPVLLAASLGLAASSGAEAPYVEDTHDGYTVGLTLEECSYAMPHPELSYSQLSVMERACPVCNDMVASRDSLLWMRGNIQWTGESVVMSPRVALMMVDGRMIRPEKLLAWHIHCRPPIIGYSFPLRVDAEWSCYTAGSRSVIGFLAAFKRPFDTRGVASLLGYAR